MTKEHNEEFENSTKFLICDKAYVDSDVKVRYHCHITEKYRGSTHRNCNINVKLNHKICIAFQNLRKDYPDSYLKCDVLLLAVFEKFRNSSL